MVMLPPLEGIELMLKVKGAAPERVGTTEFAIEPTSTERLSGEYSSPEGDSTAVKTGSCVQDEKTKIAFRRIDANRMRIMARKLGTNEFYLISFDKLG